MGSSFGKSGKLKFLTFWDALLQAIFFTICFVNDLIGTNEDTPKKIPLIRKLKDLVINNHF
jgi:preprotein translocase subunit SecG